MAISKKTVYSLFILKFFFSISLIFWTIKITLTAGVGTDDDNSFLSSYSNLNENYNKIAKNNKLFLEKYTIDAIINNKKIKNLTYNDVFLSQRSVKSREERKNILNYNKNTMQLIIHNKQTNEIVKNISASIVLTRPSTHANDIKFDIKHSNEEYSFNLDVKAYWNMMGIIKIDEYEGHFYIKTNSK